MAERERAVRRIREGFEFLAQRTFFLSYQALITSTPVDTGFARAGWVPSVGSAGGGRARDPITGRFTSGGTSGGEGPSGPATPSGEDVGQISQRLQTNTLAAQSISQSYRFSQGNLLLINNTAYLPSLNMGSSAQAPSMFIERAIALAVRRAEQEFAALRL